MTASLSVRSTPLAIKGVRVVWPRLLAVRLDFLAIVEGRDLLMTFSLEDSGPRIREVRALGFKPSFMALSPSRKYLLLSNEHGNWFEVRDAKKTDSLVQVSGPDRFHCAFGSVDDLDVLVSATRPGMVEVLSLPDGDVLSRVRWERPKPFVVESVQSVGDGATFALVGHPFLGLTSTYLFVPTASLQENAEEMPRNVDRAIEDRPSLDVAVGPCGWDDVLVFERAGGRGPAPGRTQGLSVRSLFDGQIVEEIPCNRNIGPRHSLMGTSLAVAVGIDGGVEVLARRDLTGVAPVFVPARAVSFDPEAGRFAVATPDCRFEVWELARV
jgi:hypothetical protein